MMLNLFFWKKGSRGSKGQGALEYLLIIGAAILIAAIVVTILVKTTKTTEGSVDKVYGDFNKIVSDINYGSEALEICDDACINEKFKNCEVASHVEPVDGFSVEILGADGDYCKVKFVWVNSGKVTDQDMVCWMDNNKDMNNSFEDAFDINTSDENPKCKGDYYDAWVNDQS